MRLSLSSLVAGMMLCDVPSPALVLDCTTARQRCTADELDAALARPSDPSTEVLLRDLLYVHTSVVRGRDTSLGAVGSINRRTEPTVVAEVDATIQQVGGSDCFAALGLNNHFTGGYYWGRSSGPGAAMPAPGIDVRPTDDGTAGARSLELLRVGNTNDGKRSEWCEFLVKGDTLQIVPGSLQESFAAFEVLVGLTRDGDKQVPRGAEPVVEACWKSRGDGGWVREWG
jgi:hypothetical protein